MDEQETQVSPAEYQLMFSPCESHVNNTSTQRISNVCRETGHIFVASIVSREHLTLNLITSADELGCNRRANLFHSHRKSSSRMCLCFLYEAGRKMPVQDMSCTRDPLTRDLHVVCLLMPQPLFPPLIVFCLLDSWVTCYPFTGREFDFKSILPSFILTLFLSQR